MRTDHLLGQKQVPINFKKLIIIQIMFSNDNSIKLESTDRRDFWKFTIKQHFHNNQWAKDKIMKKISKKA